jgi:DNA-binding transcriptional ArsR family regulator
MILGAPKMVKIRPTMVETRPRTGKRTQDEILGILFDGEMYVNEIVRRRGTADGITGDLHALLSKQLVTKREEGNRDYYRLTAEGARKVLLSDRSALAKSLKRLDMVLSGRLQIAGPSQMYLRPDGTIEKDLWTDPKTGKTTDLKKPPKK